MFKIWGIGDITKEGLGTNFTHVEAPEGTDVNNHITLQRAFRNLYELQEDVYKSLIDIIKVSSRSSGILKEGDFDVEVKTVDGVNYIRIKPGIAFTGEYLLVNRPQVHVASRQLENILNLVTWTTENKREYVEIVYDEANDLFSATIKENGNTHTSFNGSANFNSGIELLYAISLDFPSSFTGVNLLDITLEPTFVVPVSNRYIGIDDEGMFYASETSGAFDLFQVNTSGNIIDDFRTYYKLYNQFENNIELNVKSDGVNVNDNASLIIKKLTGGDAELKWNDSENRFEFNKNLRIDAPAISNDQVLYSNNGVLTGEDQLAVSRGGTSIGSYEKGDILYASDASTLTKLAKGEEGSVLKISTADTPEWGLGGTLEHTLTPGEGINGDGFDGSSDKEWEISFSNSNPVTSGESASPGTSNISSRGDHRHQTNVFHVGADAPDNKKLLWVETN